MAAILQLGLAPDLSLLLSSHFIIHLYGRVGAAYACSELQTLIGYIGEIWGFFRMRTPPPQAAGTRDCMIWAS